jgi:all-trans-retinol 13,14-reductase
MVCQPDRVFEVGMTEVVNRRSYKHVTLGDKWDVVVIGSGIGGLTAAVLLSVHGGKRVLVLERHYAMGGFTHTFRRPGYEWDVGLHYIGQVQDATSSVRRAFDHVTEGRVRWNGMPEVYDQIIAGGQKFDLTRGLEQYRERMKGYFPSEIRAIDKYIAAVRSSNRASGLYYAEKAVPELVSSIAGGLMRAPFLRWATRTTGEVLHDLTSNRDLIGVLTGQWGDYGLPPAQSSFGIHATIAGHYFDGGSYPVGGSSTIAAAMAPIIERNGGRVITSAEVANIVLDGEKAVGVKMAGGREFIAPVIISDAGAANTFFRLVAAETACVSSLRDELRSIPVSVAHVGLYAGIKATDDDLGLKGTNLWIYPSLDHDANVARFAKDIHSPFASLYISFPSAKDPDFANRYPGRSTVEVLTFVPFEQFAGWRDTKWQRRGPSYDSLKQLLAARLRAELERHVPAVAGRIDYSELSTPVTTRHFMNYENGEIYGIASTPARFRMRALGARTPIRNLYLTGQDVTSLGVVGALYGGAISASAALGKNLVSKLAKPFAAP